MVIRVNLDEFFDLPLQGRAWGSVICLLLCPPCYSGILSRLWMIGLDVMPIGIQNHI